MNKKTIRARLRKEYPGKTFSLLVEDYYFSYTGNSTIEKKIFLHDCCTNPNGGLASGFGKSWDEAYENMLLDKKKHGKAQEAGNATG